ncbi:type 2 lanthipeptide synthetase LanM family protein [Actinomyces wuliandei]|uniref:type 2 lanthipeptide synthetase LanM family protein n=1 Tax=Actinomyces wuliandei TaxID=2057743 RepID=UPI0013E3F9F0|nr:type 2 lanthipeptide synthetase LanM family protein [Actinomyces wuliandei]
MTYYEPERVRDLFPELPDIEAVNLLLAEVSSMDPAMVPSPAHNVLKLSSVAPVRPTESSQEYLGFDGFARRVCHADRVVLQKIFEGAEVSIKHALDLAESAWLVLVDRVQQVSSRTLIAAMHVLRDNGQLQGNSSEERYEYFCRLSASEEFERGLLRVFPELSNQISYLRAEAAKTLRTFLVRLERIKKDDQFQAIVGSNPALLSLTSAGSDPHAGGQSVLIAEFENNNNRIVYKPRQMGAELGFGRLVERFNQSAATNLPTLRIIDSDDHGWQEYANMKDGGCADEYFRKCGHLLAILHITGASDMHYENVINHNGGPVVVDAETLFSVNMRRNEGGKEADDAMVALAESVFSTGFLPSRIDTVDGSSESVDVGFLGYEPGQTAITASTIFRDIGTDRMSVDFGFGEISEPSVVPPTATSPDAPGTVASAFGQLYDWISAHKREVSNWIDELFSGVHVRAVLDNTRKYYQLLSLATHPEFQMSPELTTVLFHRCGIGRMEHVTPAVIRAEIRDLKQRDIPYFTLRSDETGVYDSQYKAVADPLAMPPLTRARQSLERMSEHKREFNIRTIHSSFVNKTSADLDRPGWGNRSERRNRPAWNSSVLSSNGLDDLVRIIAEQYARFAIRPRNGDPVEWLGATLSNTTQVHPWRFRQLSDGLYAGRSGLSLFLTAASEHLGDSKYADLAEDYLLPRANERIYSGYAHGLAGLMAALSTYGVHSPCASALLDDLEQKFVSLFEEVEMPWSISSDAADRRAHGWCHGAPGILVSELVRFRNGSDSRGQQIEELTELVADECFDLNFSLCHGDIGNLVILQQAADLQDRADLLVKVNQRANALAAEIVPRAMARYNAKTLLNDAFMVSLPGVAYGLVQLQGGGWLPDIFTCGVVQ